MNNIKYVSSIKINIEFPNEANKHIEVKNKILNIFNEFGFNHFVHISYDYDNYKAKSYDYILESLKQRTKFALKRINEESNVKIIGYKLKSIILDSKFDDSLFKLKVD